MFDQIVTKRFINFLFDEENQYENMISTEQSSKKIVFEERYLQNFSAKFE